MRGFQPAAGRPAARNYADGGNVTRQKAAPAKGFKGGGPVRGPGTGTSDDVKDVVPPGTYIMPTDSTQHIGEETLEAMGAKAMEPGEAAEEAAEARAGVPVNLSNGEFKLPPEQVHAIGVQTLNQMRDATHAPVGFAPAGAQPVQHGQPGKPEQFFADGGDVKMRPGNQPAKSIYSGVGFSGGGSAPAAPTPAPAPEVKQSEALAAQLQALPAPQFQRDIAQKQRLESQIQSAQANERYEAAGAQMAAEARAAATMRMNRAAQRPLAAPSLPPSAGEAALAAHDASPKVIVGGGDGKRMNATQDPRSMLYSGPKVDGQPNAAPPAANAAPAAASPAPAAAPAAAPAQPATQAAASPPPAPAAASPAQTAPAAPANNVTREGNSYSGGVIRGDNITINGQEPGGGYMVARGFQPSQAQPAPVNPNDPTPGVAILGTMDATNERNRNVRSSFGPNDGLSARQRAAFQQQRDQLDLQREQMAQQGQIAGMQNATTVRGQDLNFGATTRGQDLNYDSTLRGHTINGQVAMDRNNIDASRVGSENQVRGFAIREAQMLEGLRNKAIAEKDPTKRAEIVQQIRGLTGKEDHNRFTVVPGGQEWDAQANVMRNVPGRVLNNQTGQYVEPTTAQATKTPPANHIEALKKDPNLSAQFDSFYGNGAAAKILGNK